MAIRKPVQFGIGDGYSYVFPTKVQSFRTNFANVRPITTSVVGISGGVDDIGRGVHPTEYGNVTMSFWIAASDQDELEAKRDQIMGMVALGTQALIYQHDSEYRWCWAYINSADVTFNASDAPANNQRVQLNFRVDDPHWYSIPQSLGGPIWNDDGSNWGTGVKASDPQYDQGTVVDGGTITLVNNGNMFAPAQVCWEVDGGTATGGTISDMRLYRLARNGAIADDITYGGTVVGGGVVWIDAVEYTVPVGDIDLLTYSTPGWLMVPAGTTEFYVGLGQGTAVLTVDYEDRWT